MKESENKVKYAELKRQIADKKALLLRMKSEYKKNAEILSKIKVEIDKLEADIAVLATKQNQL